MHRDGLQDEELLATAQIGEALGLLLGIAARALHSDGRLLELRTSMRSALHAVTRGDHVEALVIEHAGVAWAIPRRAGAITAGS